MAPEDDHMIASYHLTNESKIICNPVMSLFGDQAGMSLWMSQQNC